MRKQGNGTIVNISSIGGITGWRPFANAYHSSKARMVFILSNSQPGNKIRLAISESRKYIEYKGLQDTTRRE